jgi:hypothetical protein
MIQDYVDRFMANKSQLRKAFKKHPGSYLDIVKATIEVISSGDYGDLDPKRIHEIDDGDYQGTLLYVIAASAYQPSEYWYVKVGYGSCSGCDALQDIKHGTSLDYMSDDPSERQKDLYEKLALEIVQRLKKME